MTLSSVTIQITPESKPSTPSWMGEAAVFAQVLTHAGILKAIQDQVRFTRARFQEDLHAGTHLLPPVACSTGRKNSGWSSSIGPCACPRPVGLPVNGPDEHPHYSTGSQPQGGQAQG